MNTHSPRPISSFDHSGIKVVFTDIDDTLTWEGRLPVETFNALQSLKDAGIIVVPVTGASGGWADCIVRTWPVSSLIAENGSFWLEQRPDNFVERHFWYDEQKRAENFVALRTLGAEFKQAFPMIDYTVDQDFRLTDIAFDIGQQVHIDPAIAQEATDWWHQHGVSARLSSIHINVWVGDYSKAAMALHWLENHPHIDVEDCVFIGDSLNDDTMFATFPVSVGVANIERFLDRMDHKPTYITENMGGYGFCELANILLNIK
ncbi:HAD family hydrolase [Terasakiella pusilla]|uniref:HAD family hydrolase n=1 Tax=Terasakiella pusilla TaxID=64973 RepID=UPI003AA7FD29